MGSLPGSPPDNHGFAAAGITTDCVDADDCIWLESHCISLNFSK